MAEYLVDNILTIAGAPDGTVYLANLVQPENIKDFGYYIYHYDEKGECLGTYPMGEYCLTHGMAVGEDGTLYFIAEHSDNVLRLFAFRTETEQIDEVCRFPYFKQVKKLVYLDGRLYVLGQESWGTGFTDFSTGEYDFSAGERLVYCDSKTGEVYGLNFDFPINIAPGEGCLTVLGYLESEGYCVMEYDPAADTMRVRQKLDAFLFDDFAVCNDGNSLLYSYASNQFGLLLSDYGNLEQEAEVYRGALQLTQVEYAGGRIYCEDGRSGHLVGFPFSAVQRTKRVIHLITASYSVAPYGCGYVLDRIDMNWDKIVLKTLAQDKDYDLCIASSADTGSRVMKESDSFYPLNDIPGVEEYLNCCLPYVREAAMKEDGTIWMLPFRVEAKGLLVQEEKLAKQGVSIHEGMSYAEFAEMIHGLLPFESAESAFRGDYAGGKETKSGRKN